MDGGKINIVLKISLKQLRKIFSKLVVVSLIIVWLFSGWPTIWNKPTFPPKLEKASAAISAVTGRGSSVSGTGNNTSITVNPTANITVGKMAFFAVVTDNESASDGCSGTLHTLNGSAGNTWTKILECTESDGASNDGNTISLFATKVTNQINTTDSVTVQFNTGRSDIIGMLFEATVGAGNSLEVAQTGIGQNSLSSSVASLVSREYLLLNLVGAEGEDNAKTATTNYTELFDLRTTTSGNLDVNIASYVQTRIATLTSSTATPGAWTFTNAFSSLTALFEEVIPTLAISQPDGASDTITVGDSYNITYTLADSDDTVTSAFYYDTDTDMAGGTAISGGCATAAEGTNTTCSWDTTGVTPGSYYIYGVTSGDSAIGGEVRAVSSGQITINSGASSLTLIVSTDTFPSLTPGSYVFATSTISVDTDNASGWNVALSRDDADTTLDLSTDAAVNIVDQTSWVPGADTSSAGNAVRMSLLDNSGDVLAFRLMTASGTASFISTAWWGNNDTYVDNVSSFWSGIPASAQQVGNSSSSSGGSPALNTILYYLDVPSTQRTGTYNGDLTFTATMN